MIALCASAARAADGGTAGEGTEAGIEEVEVTGDRPLDTATARSLDRQDVEAFPARSADELLRAVPGLLLSAHGGNGKAFQFLVRGFDAEHGADLAVSVEGVPLNERSQVHGQGYLDVHFLPTVLVDGLEVTKGAYRAEDGDFATAGSVDYAVGLAPEGLLLRTRLGTDGSGAGSAAWRPAGRGPGTFLVAEAEGAVGVGEGRRYAMERLAAGLDGEVGRLAVRVAAFAYDGAFASPGALREDDLALGDLGFYDAYPVPQGGRSTRGLAFAAAEGAGERGGGRVVAWVDGRAFTLDQNFTGWYFDPVHGDGTRQSQVGVDGGARAEAVRLLPVGEATWALRGGLDALALAATQREQAITTTRRPWDLSFLADVRQADLGAWAEARAPVGPVTLVLGARADQLAFAVRDAVDPLGQRIADPAWARSAALVPSPKASASWQVAPPLALFAAAGRGFRSPTARGTAAGDRAPVVTADSAEVGARLVPAPPVSVAATAFGIAVADELVFDHVAGRFLSAGRTRRLGVEAVADWRTASWMRLEADVTVTDGRFVASGEPIAYAPRAMVAGAAFAEGARLAGGRLTGGLRAWALGPRPLPDGFASRSAVVGSFTSRWEGRGLWLGLDVDDVFGNRWRDGEFVFPSWFDRSAARSELKVLHVTAGTPFAARVTLGGRFGG